MGVRTKERINNNDKIRIGFFRLNRENREGVKRPSRSTEESV